MPSPHLIPQYLDRHPLLIYNDILERTGASSATISRVNRSLNYGAGGYEDVFRNLAQQTQEEKR